MPVDSFRGDVTAVLNGLKSYADGARYLYKHAISDLEIALNRATQSSPSYRYDYRDSDLMNYMDTHAECISKKADGWYWHVKDCEMGPFASVREMLMNVEEMERWS